MSSKKTKYANLLASKCLSSKKSEEIEALLGLNLDIDWNHAVSHMNDLSLVDLAFLNIEDGILFKEAWRQISLSLNVNPWDKLQISPSYKDISFVGIALMNLKLDTLNDWLKDNPGTKDQWDELFSNNKIKMLSLSNKWGLIQQRVEENKLKLDNDFFNHLSQFSKDNKWLNCSNKDVFAKLSPKTWTPAQSITWYRKIIHFYKNPKNNIQKNGWLMKEFLNHKEGWSKWSKEDWEYAANITPSSFSLFYINKLGIKDTNVDEFISLLENNKNKDHLFDEIYDLLEMDKNIKRISYSVSNWNLSPTQTADFTNLKSWANKVKKKAKNFKFKNAQKKIKLGILLAAIDTSIFKKTKISDQALKLLSSNIDHLPEDFEDFKKLLLSDHLGKPVSLKIEDVLFEHERLAALSSHIVKAYETDIDKMSKFVDSLKFPLSKDEEPLLENKSKDEKFATSIAQWSQRIGTDCSSLATTREWAHIFWRSVFSMPTANQHYWLKKVAKDKSLQVDLRFWDEDFKNKIEGSMDRRKRTPDIHALLGKMSLLNETNQVSPIQQKVTRRKSKI